jgi:hypothetical protein
VAGRLQTRMQAQTSNTNRPHPGITHPARSRLTTTWPLQPEPLASSVGVYCNKPSSVSGGEAEDSWYVGDGQLCSSSKGKSCFFCFSSVTRRKIIWCYLRLQYLLPSLLEGHAPSRLPSCRPVVDLQRATVRQTCARNRRQPSHLVHLLGPIAGTSPLKPPNPVLSRR